MARRRTVTGHNHGLELYIQQITGVRPLPQDEELRLLGLAKAGDLAARGTVTLHNLSLVADALKDRGLLDFGDPMTPMRVEAGNLALAEAVAEFVPHNGGFRKQAIDRIGRAITAAAAASA